MQTATTVGRRSPTATATFAPPPPRPVAAEARVADLVQPTSRLARAPWLTLGILAVLGAIYALELGVSAQGGHPGRVSHTTLVKLGGLSRDLALDHGQLWRMLTVSLLHLNLGHLIGNAVALVLVGLLLEPIVGRRWFALIYFVGGLGGALGSLVLNPPQILSVGASGAIMGLLSCSLVLSLHTASFGRSRRMQMLCLRVMAPALLPLSGGHVDYSGHIGGALAGALLGFLLQIVWSEDRPRPPQPWLAGGLAVAAAVVSGLVLTLATLAPDGPPSGTLGLIPIDDTPRTMADWTGHASELALQYPSDPRPHAFKAAALAIAHEDATAEVEYLYALRSPLLTAPEVPPTLETTVRTALIGLYAREGRMDKARTMAAPLCAAPASVTPKIMKALQTVKLCEA